MIDTAMSNLESISKSGRDRSMAIPEGTFVGNVSGFIGANSSDMTVSLDPAVVLGLQTMNQFLLNNKV